LLVSFTLFNVVDAEDDDDTDLSRVTCGSVMKLRHIATNFRLHSHNVQYGSGSGQQSVTAFPNVDDTNSFWVVRGSKPCKTGTPIKNGDVIRLEHLGTRKLLHSHLHQSPLTKQQEVSAFGEGGVGDTGDNWKVTLLDGGDQWKREKPFTLMHSDTNKYLSSNKQTFSNPIPGQHEVCAISSATKDAEWTVEEGFFFPEMKDE